MKKLSIIIPVRTTTNYDVVERLRYKRMDSSVTEDLECIVVDDGSDQQGAAALKAESERLGYKYLRVDSENKYFSLARARNFGVQHATGKYVLIEDVDISPYQGFYSDILDEIELWDLDKKQEDFFVIPVIYLTEKASTDFLQNNSRLQAKKIIQKYLEFDMSYYESGIPCGSMLVVSRHHYLSVGGQNERFERWGFEDHEFANRLLHFSKKFPDPINPTAYFPTKFEEYTRYEGFRARYRLHGDLVAAKGIYAFHIHHPVSQAFRSTKIRASNQGIFESCAKELVNNPYYLGSLDNLQIPERTLLSSKNPFVLNHEIWPLLGEVFFYDEPLYSTEEYLQFVKDNRITTVIMQNPYKNAKKLETYNSLKALGVRCVVSERGALPNSVYFDETGFCCESSKYKSEYWDFELTEEEKEKTREYIKEYKSTGVALEKQAPQIGGANLKKKLGIYGRKVLFVPFQTKADVTVNCFAGKIESYENFLNLVQEVADKLPRDWVLCYKNHPIEPTKNELNNAICVDEYHINDLLEASDGVLLMNSGCGILAMLYGVPVLHCSQAQYDCPKFNRYVSSVEEVLGFCQNPFKVNEEEALKFIHYLVFKLYSFAENVYQKHPGKPDTWPVRLIFKTIRYPGLEDVSYSRSPEQAIWRKSVLFDRYRTFMEGDYTKLRAKGKTKKVSKPTPVPIPKAESKQDLKQEKQSLESRFFNQILSEKMARKYNRDRVAFFRDSRNPVVRFYYKVFG